MAEPEPQESRSESCGHSIPQAAFHGFCGICKGRRRTGKVRLLHCAGTSEDDVAAGSTLACSSKPLGEVEIAV